MKPTIERIILEDENCRPESIAYKEHTARYEFVSKFVNGKTVLDFACGVGYGSKILHDAGAKKIIGCDISKEAIVYAKKNFTTENTTFQIMDAENIGFKDNTFDCIVSFETIEHIKKYQTLLKEFYRLLNKEGLLIISTPNRNRFNRPANPFHYKEFTKDEFINLLNEYFKNIVLYSQVLYIKNNKKRLLKSLVDWSVQTDVLNFRKILGRNMQDKIADKVENTNKQYDPILYNEEHIPRTFIALCNTKVK